MSLSCRVRNWRQMLIDRVTYFRCNNKYELCTVNTVCTFKGYRHVLYQLNLWCFCSRAVRHMFIFQIYLFLQPRIFFFFFTCSAVISLIYGNKLNDIFVIYLSHSFKLKVLDGFIDEKNVQVTFQPKSNPLNITGIYRYLTVHENEILHCRNENLWGKCAWDENVNAKTKNHLMHNFLFNYSFNVIA